MIDAIVNVARLIEQSPAHIVKILYGIGVKPAMVMANDSDDYRLKIYGKI